MAVNSPNQVKHEFLVFSFSSPSGVCYREASYQYFRKDRVHILLIEIRTERKKHSYQAKLTLKLTFLWMVHLFGFGTPTLENLILFLLMIQHPHSMIAKYRMTHKTAHEGWHVSHSQDAHRVTHKQSASDTLS